MYRNKRGLSRGALLLLLGALLLGSYGCGQSEKDSSDPDPHYYKGKDFVHKRTR